MTDRHTHDWTPHTTDDTGRPTLWACTECDTTTVTCVVTDTRRKEHPTGTSNGICDPCLHTEAYVLDDIHAALTHWDERDRDPGRSPMAFQLVRAHGSTGQSSGVRYPEDIHHELLAWAIRWATHTGAMTNGDPAGYIKTRHLWAAQNPDQSDWHTYRREIRDLRTAARAITGLTPDRHPEACMYCGGRIVQDRADHHWQPLPNGRTDTVRCTRCRLAWKDRDDFQINVRHHIWELPHEYPDQLVTLDHAVRIFPDVPRSTFRNWIADDRRQHAQSIDHCDQWEDEHDAWYADGNIGPHPQPPEIYERRLPERGWTRDDRPLYRLGDLHAKVEYRATTDRRGRPAQPITNGRITA